MLEQVLEGIEADAAPQKIHAFLALVDSLETPEDKAEALASFAKSRIKTNALDAIKAMQCAYRLAPRKDSVLEVIEFCFEQLKRNEAKTRIAKYRKDIAPKIVLKVKPEPAEFSIEFDKNSQTSQVKVERTTVGGHNGFDSVRDSVSTPSINLEFDIDHVTNTESVPLTFVGHKNEPPPELSVIQSEPKITLTFSQGDYSYALFGEFLRATEMDFRVLERADGFQDSMLGLVLFVNYLFESGLIPENKSEKVISTLKSFVGRKNSDARSQVRFHELFERAQKE